MVGPAVVTLTTNGNSPLCIHYRRIARIIVLISINRKGLECYGKRGLFDFVLKGGKRGTPKQSAAGFTNVPVPIC